MTAPERSRAEYQRAYELHIARCLTCREAVRDGSVWRCYRAHTLQLATAGRTIGDRPLPQIWETS